MAKAMRLTRVIDAKNGVSNSADIPIRTLMKNLILLTLFISFHTYGQSDSSLDSACKQNGFSCGECETGLQNEMNALLSNITGGQFTQGEHWGDGKEKTKNSGNIPMAPGVTLESTLGKIIDLYKKNNPVGDNKLNFVVIGESESAQGTSVKDGKMNPRIMLKSPNSELMVTFNTDPQAKGYNTLEVMRWNGKQGRYEFQELNFGEKGEKPHVDASGTKCMECHKESSRPNWDTYRAWAGVVPSRDDMMEMHSNAYEFQMDKGMQPDARAYLGFLEQMAKDKDSGKKSRIAMLDIPFDERNQLKDYVKAAGDKPLTSAEKIDIIKQKINKDGFYRVKHFPDKAEARNNPNSKMAFNFDGKTAEYAGPSQFAFDQMLAQNMCKVATDLKHNKDFDKFKYGVALLMKCGKEGRMDGVYPDSFKEKVMKHFKGNNYSDLQDIDPTIKAASNPTSFPELNELIRKDTAQSHENANGFKFNRHGRFLASYLSGVEKLPPEEVKQQANYYSREVMSPTQSGFHAIADQGGVKGVGEDSTNVMSDLRMLLEPFGVKVGHWSLVHGKSNAYNSFSFSDQFSLFKSQPVWDEVFKEAGSCKELENRTRSALDIPPERKPMVVAMTTPNVNEGDDVDDIAVVCAQLGLQKIEPTGRTWTADIMKPVLEKSKKELKKSMEKCLTCHDVGGDIEFPGLADFVNNKNEKEFVNFLNTKSDYYNKPMVEVFQIKLGAMPVPQDGISYGDQMPPSDWSDNLLYSAKNSINVNKVQKLRRRAIALMLDYTAKTDRDQKLKELCEKINNDNYIKDFDPKSTSKKSPGKASKQ